MNAFKRQSLFAAVLTGLCLTFSCAGFASAWDPPNLSLTPYSVQASPKSPQEAQSTTDCDATIAAEVLKSADNINRALVIPRRVQFREVRTGSNGEVSSVPMSLQSVCVTKWRPRRA